MINSFYGKIDKDVKPLKGFIVDTVKRLNTERYKNSSLINAWRKNVDTDILEHTEVDGIKGGVLTIKVDSAIWLHNIVAFRKQELLRSMQEGYKSRYIYEIKFKIGKIRE
jgi:predicted nucleic acid-binding Zn ribbon protein